MKKLLIIGLIGLSGVWVFVGPLDGHLPSLMRIRSKLVMQISSNAFTNKGDIPARFTCSGENINPELEFSGIPADAKSLALTLEDPDATSGTFVHWVVFNIKPDVKFIPEGAGAVPGIQARNGAGMRLYTGPCPPTGTHRYFFKLYALDRVLPPDEILDIGYLRNAMNGHILDQVQLMGNFRKPN